MEPPVDARSSQDAGEAAASQLGEIETAWPIIFGRPPQDTQPDEKFYCEWFENRTFSPCGGGKVAFTECWQVDECPI